MPASSSSPARRRSPAVALAAFALLALLVTACGTTSTPRARVAADLGCTAARTQVAKLPPDQQTRTDMERWQVSGCGRSAVYLCTIPVRDCWREGQIRPGDAVLTQR